MEFIDKWVGKINLDDPDPPIAVWVAHVSIRPLGKNALRIENSLKILFSKSLVRLLKRLVSKFGSDELDQQKKKKNFNSCSNYCFIVEF